MIVALLKTESADIPAATVKALRVPLGASERATVGGLRGVGYTALSLQGVNGLADLYTLRTAGGLLTITCIAPIDDPLPAGSCPSDVTHVSVTVPPVADPAEKLKGVLPSLTATLNTARTDGRQALRANGDSDAQRDAALGLKRAYTTAAASAAAVAPKSGKGSDVPADFRAAAGAYDALAKAANRHDRRAWANARKAVDAAEARATAAVAALGS
jgi:hypothetical protein